MRAALLVARRELAGYFATPVAYVFIVIQPGRFLQSRPS